MGCCRTDDMTGGTAGSTYFLHPNNSGDDCKLMCDSDAACMGFEYSETAQKCEIHAIAMPMVFTKGTCSKYECFVKDGVKDAADEAAADEPNISQGRPGNVHHLSSASLVSLTQADGEGKTSNLRSIGTGLVSVAIGFACLVGVVMLVNKLRSSPRAVTFTANELDLSWDDPFGDHGLTATAAAGKVRSSVQGGDHEFHDLTTEQLQHHHSTSSVLVV